MIYEYFSTDLGIHKENMPKWWIGVCELLLGFKDDHDIFCFLKREMFLMRGMERPPSFVYREKSPYEYSWQFTPTQTVVKYFQPHSFELSKIHFTQKNINKLYNYQAITFTVIISFSFCYTKKWVRGSIIKFNLDSVLKIVFTKRILLKFCSFPPTCVS